MKTRNRFSVCWSVVMFVVVSASFTGNSFAQFRPNDPYFNAGTAGGTAAGYWGQWHLENQMPLSPLNAGWDVNIGAAWARGLTGAGVTISVVDDGTQGDHPDLVDGFINQASWDYSKTAAQNLAETFRGSPVLVDNNHGTSVAGVAAARGGNGIGVTGAAPLATIAAQRFLVSSYADGISGQIAQARAIGFQGQTNALGEPDPSATFTPTPGMSAPVRVMNHSYGPNGGYGFAPDSPEIHEALQTSANYGVLHVFAAGNQRGEWPTQDSNTSWDNTSPYQITVAALGSNGVHSDYSSFGANVMVTAPSSSRVPKGLFAISTTDRTGLIGYNQTGDDPSEPPKPDAFFTPGTGDLSNYTSDFGGTSSAAPLVSGIMALAVEANPNIDIRMARHLLARTSVKVDAADPNWITNAAGYQFNQNYGFGLIDADAFTFAATQVASLSDAKNVDSTEQTVGTSFGAGVLSLSSTVTISEAEPLPIEFVQVTLTLSGLQANLTDYAAGVGAIIGDISASVLSPGGTRYQLFSNDRNLAGNFEKNRTRFGPALEWTFLSHAYFGESINGNWTVTLNNGSTNTNYANFGTWDSYQIGFGTGTLALIPEPSVVMLLLIAGIGFVFWKKTRMA